MHLQQRVAEFNQSLVIYGVCRQVQSLDLQQVVGLHDWQESLYERIIVQVVVAEIKFVLDFCQDLVCDVRGARLLSVVDAHQGLVALPLIHLNVFIRNQLLLCAQAPGRIILVKVSFLLKDLLLLRHN